MDNEFEEKVLVCEGTLMRFDRPLGAMSIDEYDHVEFTPIEPSPRYYPYEMREAQTALSLLKFFRERVTPPTRNGLSKSLKEAGYERYSIAAVLLTSNGRDCSDYFWVRFEEGPQTWKEVWEAVGVSNHLDCVTDR